MSKISVIVPVYNVEYYLKKCIRSIVKQSYKNLEIILVDDGSSDKSGLICDVFAKKDKRIKVIHKNNSGVSDARNVGIDNATGYYITFVDSDDWVPKNYIEILYNAMVEKDSDICIGSLQFIKLITKDRLDVNDFYVTRNSIMDFVNIVLDCKTINCAVTKLYKTEIIKNNSIRFNNAISFGEDTIFVLDYLLYTDRMQFVKKAVYNYNRLVVDSAITKYYPKCNLWEKEIIDKLERLCFINDKHVQMKFFDKAQAVFLDICKHYMLHLDGKQALNKIQETIILFDKYIFCDYISNALKEFYSNISDKKIEDYYNQIVLTTDVFCKVKLYRTCIKKMVLNIKKYFIFKFFI